MAIESTCDETGAAVAVSFGESMAVKILSDVKASSAEMHAKYGGVIPEIAAREQIAAIIPVISEAIAQAKIKTGEIEAIAVTRGPGLIGSLLIGVETAKALAMAWKKPLIAVNHMVAHVFANWIGEKTPEFPAVALVVSGGHTDLMYLESLTRWQWVGGTRDDAAGEAFDKAARAMGFPYPGGPMVAKAAGQSSEELPTEMKLPRPMIHEANLEMSFSGLKTALAQVIEQNGERLSENPGLINALAREFNQAVADVLIKKTMKAVEQFQPKSVLLAGGVAANVTLREGLARAVKEAGKEFFCPNLEYCTDNAAMIAACALLRPNYVDPLKLRPDPGLGIR
ncbi:MAG TPA: tRNA (adenosine(37)-N6)-threonylcarbamoyltransferase complex transferase subunit TsaD [Patescibacteria group bacterium]|nr:tRNA (adenosine(37)-N6)-threonylcarbamoyltransferase complex transferase subunit TsaD [Patescibacteria group bacterium]